MSKREERYEHSSSVLGANHLSWLEHLPKVAQARLENMALGSGAGSSQPMFWQLGCARSDLEKVINAGVEVHGWELLKVLRLLITGCNSRYTAAQSVPFMLYLLLTLLVNSCRVVPRLFDCDTRQH